MNPHPQLMHVPSDKGKTFFVSGVCCATEEAIVRKRLDALIGPECYTFNALTCELSVRQNVNDQKVVQHLREAGFDTRSKQELETELPFWERHAETALTGIGALFAATGMLLEYGGAPPVVAHGVLLAAILVGGWRIFSKALRAFRIYTLDMNVLMSIAVLGALLIGKWGEAAAVIVLFSVSLALESYSASRTRKTIRSLMTLTPDQASVLRGGLEVAIRASEVVPGDIMLIRPGERIPLDGLVVEGSSSANESLITGEVSPAAKTVGDDIFAGSINERGSLRVRVTKRFEDTTVARIIHLVQDAQQQRAPIQQFVDRFARVYTPVILAIAVAIALLPPLLFHEPFGEWFYRALVMLVIACPCALVISTPVTLVGALTYAARHGILIKGGKHIEVLSAVRAIAFDKTGTLTEGKVRVTDVLPLNSLPRDRVLRLVGALELRSEHPFASAVLAEAERHNVPYADIDVESFEAMPGLGVKAVIGGVLYYLGNQELARTRGYNSAVVQTAVEQLTREGKTAVILGKEREALALLGVRDTARKNVAHALDRLKRLGMRHMVMLSGDHETMAHRITREVGLEHYAAGLLPSQKVELIDTLKSKYGVVAMVGDGMNDAPALAASSVGIAMGAGGSDAVLETADVVLMSDDLSRLPLLFGLSRKTLSIIRQNVALALALKVLFLVLSLAGVATLWMAVLADDGAALAVIANGLRILSYKDDQ